MSIQAVIQGIGHGVPSRVLTNDDLSKIVETSDEWIFKRTGMRERRILSEGENCSDLCIASAREALEASGIDAEELDLIIVGTVSGDMLFPSTASIVQNAIGAKKAGAFDLGAACAGFIYALSVSSSMIKAGQAKTVLCIGADVLTRFVDWTDRSTCVLFGDGAGGVVIRGESDTDRGILDTVVLCDGEGGRHINVEVGGSKHPAGEPGSAAYRHKVFMAGAEVYRFAVSAMGDACMRVLEKAGMTPDDVDLFVPHQANLRIIESAASKIGLCQDKVYVNVHRYGNTSAGSIPLGLYEAQQEGRLKKGDVVLTVGFGAGLVWGANLIRW